MTVRFDDSLPTLLKLVSRRFGPDHLADAVVVRDAGGRLSIVLPRPIDHKTLATVDEELRRQLGAYARPDFVIRDQQSTGAQRLLLEGAQVSPLRVLDFDVRLLDRRIVGADWLKPPAPSYARIPRVVFVSLKGGVGRSTALCVLAAHLSRRGRRVLAIDFDLEAPGLGTMLLRDQELPRFGALDYLVENGLSGVDDTFIADLVGDSYLGAEGARVAVIPAIGACTIENPTNALGKIARAYLEDPRENGPAASLGDQLREMIERFESSGAYDAVLVDARAGLHETTAAAVLALGGDVLLFGTDHPQTFLGYRLLMAHLARFPNDPDDDWRDRLRFVHARAPDSSESRKVGDEKFMALYDLVVQRVPEPADTVKRLTADEFDLAWDESADGEFYDRTFEPMPPLHILDDSRFRNFDPISDHTLLSPGAYKLTFGSLLDYADIIIEDEGPLYSCVQ